LNHKKYNRKVEEVEKVLRYQLNKRHLFAEIRGQKPQSWITRLNHKDTTAKSKKSQKYGAALTERAAFIRGNSRNSRTKTTVMDHGLNHKNTTAKSKKSKKFCGIN
jgi:hypothetical protein